MQKNDGSVFHAYDIRGLQYEEITNAFADRLARVLVEIEKPKTVVIGRDMRLSSIELEKAMVEAFIEQGVDVVLIGLCSTPLMNITVGLADGAYDLGIMITASHNPAEYNGFKLTRKDVLPIGQGSGMERIKERFLSEEAFHTSDHRGSVREDTRTIDRYLDYIFHIAQIDTDQISPMRIAIDTGNGMAGHILPALLKRLPMIECIPMYFELDGHFPHHEANPLKPETMKDVSQMVKEKECALGIAFDGDADRIGFVDEEGVQIPGDILTGLIAGELLSDCPNALILRDIRSSWATEEMILDQGGRTEFSRVGHAFIKKQIRETNALFGGEVSMHFYYRDFWGVESGDRTMMHILSLISKQQKRFSEIWKPYHRYINSGELNTKVLEPDAVIRRVQERFESLASRQYDMDGIRMEFGLTEKGEKTDDSWWFSLRKSNTEPLVRLIVEAVSESLMQEKREEILHLINEAT